MYTTANNEQEFGKAINNGADHIVADGELAEKIKKMMKLNAILWVFCLASLSVAIVALMSMPATAGASGAAGLVAGTCASAVLGPDVAIAAVMIAVSGGGIHTLHKLRKYRLERQSHGRIILHLEK